MELKTRFRIALAIRSDPLPEGERYTVTDFAQDHDCDRRTLYDILNGNRTSERLESAVEDFIAEQADKAELDLRAPEPAAA